MPAIAFRVRFKPQWLRAVPFWGILRTVIAVQEWFLGGLRLFTEGLHFFWRVWVYIGAAGVEELLSPWLVGIESFALLIGTMIAPN